MAELTNHRHELFARLVAGGASAAAAVRLAGSHSRGNAKQVGYALLRRPAVRARVRELREELLREYPLTRLIVQYQGLADEAWLEGNRPEAASYLDRIGAILVPQDGRAAGRGRSAGDGGLSPETAEIINRLSARAQAEEEGRIVPFRAVDEDDGDDAATGVR